jgi:hypothetical protein
LFKQAADSVKSNLIDHNIVLTATLVEVAVTKLTILFVV